MHICDRYLKLADKKTKNILFIKSFKVDHNSIKIAFHFLGILGWKHFSNPKN